MLPIDSAERKALPVFTFLTKYFLLAFLEVVRVAVDGDKQHGNTGADIYWDRSKSTDQLNTALRHLLDYGAGRKRDTDGRAHLAKAIWRLSAQLQLDEEAEPLMASYPWKTDAGLRFPMYDETGVPWGAASPKQSDQAQTNRNKPAARYAPDAPVLPAHYTLPPKPLCICTDCGADLGETGHFVTCLSDANPANR